MQLVSIIIPNYNKEKFIAQTIHSVLDQTYDNWELIIVDDNSTDASREIVKGFLNDKRISLISLDQNKGASHARNLGLKRAKGEFILFFDADDLLMKNNLETRLACASAEPEGNLLVFGMALFKKEINDDQRKWIPDTKKPLKDFLNHRLPWGIHQAFWKREFLIEVGDFDERFERLQDVEIHTRALLNPKIKLLQFPEIIDCYYRIDPERRNYNMYELLNRRAKSVSLYCKKFEEQLQENQKKLLLGTVAQTYWNLIYFRRNNNINNQEFLDCKKKLFDNTVCENLSLIKRILFRLYFFNNLRLPRIPGVNRILEEMIVL